MSDPCNGIRTLATALTCYYWRNDGRGWMGLSLFSGRFSNDLTTLIQSNTWRIKPVIHSNPEFFIFFL